MYTDEWLRLNGVWLHFQDWGGGPAGGAARAETLLLLHGLTQQSHAFDAIAPRLAGRYRCLALDLRGRGESDWAPGTYAVPQYVADVHALLDALGLGAVHVLGTSLGGLIGLSLARVSPDRLGSLALNDIGPEIDPRGAARGATYAASVPERFPDLEAAAAWAVAQYPWLERLPSEAVADTIRWASGGRRTADGGSSSTRRSDARRGRRRRRPGPRARRGGRPSRPCAVPSSSYGARRSDILSREIAASMERRQPRLRRVDVEGVGHAPTLTEPSAAAALSAFYLTLPPG